MDLTPHIKTAEYKFSMFTKGLTGGSTWLFGGRTIPKAQWKKYMSFWRCVVGEAAQSIKKAIKEMLPAWLGTHFFELLVDAFLWVIATLTTFETELCKIETSRDPPPKIFVPIPKFIEWNGCARSDSLLLAYF
ncbi:hypothetical protein QUA62_24010 [Microcoleus sp. MON1_C1]|uniref:hypothetical protein n=1 Tax=Microcoleus sp. MON1_C1 TaxID=2818827 RepID=UPI002FD2BC8F